MPPDHLTRLLAQPHCRHDASTCRHDPRRHCQRRLQRIFVIAALVALLASSPLPATVRAGVIQPLPGLATADDVALAEKAALLSLAAALGGHAAFRWAGWVNASQGLSVQQSKPCVQFWEFLSCDSHGRVSSINIANPTLAVINASWANQKTPGGLKGSIPWDSLTALEHLQAVDLSGNSISGPPFTAAISKFTALRDIQLARNALDAPLVNDLSALSNLQKLDLSGNRISGALPAGLSALTALECPYSSIIPPSTLRYHPSPHPLIITHHLIPSSPITHPSIIHHPSTHRPITPLSIPHLPFPIPHSPFPIPHIHHSIPQTHHPITHPHPHYPSLLHPASPIPPIPPSHPSPHPTHPPIPPIPHPTHPSIPPIPPSHPFPHPTHSPIPPIPPFPHHLTSELGSNAFSGPLPDSWSALSNLHLLSVPPLPPSLPLLLPPHKRPRIDLASAGVRTPPPDSCDLASAGVRTAPPDSWAALASLEIVSLHSNNLTAPFPAFLLQLPNISDMCVSVVRPCPIHPCPPYPNMRIHHRNHHIPVPSPRLHLSTTRPSKPPPSPLLPFSPPSSLLPPFFPSPPLLPFSPPSSLLPPFFPSPPLLPFSPPSPLPSEVSSNYLDGSVPQPPGFWESHHPLLSPPTPPHSPPPPPPLPSEVSSNYLNGSVPQPPAGRSAHF
ncbi:unnamed protein product, partial [Closterium sp. Naga37s-1]